MSTTPGADDQRTAQKPLSITAEEFDAKFDAGEDISDYIDWDSGAAIMPGELSPGQKRSIQVLADPENLQLGEGTTTKESTSLHVSLPSWAYKRLRFEATREGVSQEELAQLFIIQRLDQQKVSA